MSKNKKERNVIKLVRKSNELVEARYKFDIWETRVFTKMLTMIRKDDGDFQNYRIYLKDVVREFDLENNNDAYERLRAGGMKLMTKIVKVVRNTDEGMMELNTPIVVGVENPLDKKARGEDGRFINVSFHPGMKPFLLSLKSHFTTYDVRNILKLPSSYSIRIYELLKQYQKIGKRKFLLQELKEVIGVKEEIIVNGKKEYKDSYPKFGNFKQRVLLKSQRDLKAFTDITFEFDQIKKGRAVHSIMFYIYKNSAAADEKEQEQEVETVYTDETFLIEIHDAVKEWVSMSAVRSWVKKYPEEQIRKGVTYTLNQLKNGKQIDNVGGYLQKMVKEKDIVDTKAIKKEKLIAKKEKEDLNKQAKIQSEEILKMLQSAYIKEEDQIMQLLLADHPEARTSILETVKKTRFANYDDSLSIQQNLRNPMVKAAYRNAIKKRFPDAFKQVKANYEPKIQSMKRQINGM